MKDNLEMLAFVQKRNPDFIVKKCSNAALEQSLNGELEGPWKRVRESKRERERERERERDEERERVCMCERDRER